MKRKRNPILPRATYIGAVYSAAELVAALKAAAIACRPTAPAAQEER